MGRAGLNTEPAIDADKRIITPGGQLFIDRQALGRTFQGAEGAEDTFLDPIEKPSPGPFQCRPNLPGIGAGGLGAYQVAEEQGGHLKHQI